MISSYVRRTASIWNKSSLGSCWKNKYTTGNWHKMGI